MLSDRRTIYLFLIIFSISFVIALGHPLSRHKRQFDFTITAEHDDDNTELVAEAVAKLWKSKDRNTQVDGTARVIHRSGSMSSGNTKFSGSIHVHREYR